MTVTVAKSQKSDRSIGRIIKKTLLILLAILITLVLGAAGFVVWTVQRSFPTTDGQIAVSGLSTEVTVLRDEYGVPTITAKNATDLFFAQGFVHAQDRFWEMDFRRHMTAGRLSELFGKSQLGTDMFLRTLGWREIAEQETANLDEETRSYYQAYADGVNAYLSENSGAAISLEYAILGFTVPGYEPEKWQIADSIAWLKAMAWDLLSSIGAEASRAEYSSIFTPEQLALFFPEYPYDLNPTILPTDATVPIAKNPVQDVNGVVINQYNATVEVIDLITASTPMLGHIQDGIGSNSWVVSGEHTATGKPLLSNDPHLGASLPSIWHQVNLKCETVSETCPFDVSGFSFSGLPGIIIGHNDTVAWGFTNLGPDVSDLYIEKIDGDKYLRDGNWFDLEVKTETVRVAGAEDVELKIRKTGNGPIISDVADYYQELADNVANYQVDSSGESGKFALSLRWTALQPTSTASAIFALDKARNFEEFRVGASLFAVPAQNLIYADTAGNIGYQAPGLIPIRNAGNGKLPNLGWDSNYDWLGYIPFEDLPYSFNPEQGFIVTANNALVDKSWPYLITTDWDYGFRADRITDLLAEKIAQGLLTSSDMASIQTDNYNWIAEQLSKELLNGLPVNQETASAINLLKDWDYQDDADSAAAAYSNVVWKNLLHEVFTTKYETITPGGGSKWFLIVSKLLQDPESKWWQNSKLGITNKTEMLTHVAQLAYKELSQLQGKNVANWSWGKLHAITLTHQTFGSSGIAPLEWLFNRGPYDIGGGSSIVNATGWTSFESYSTATVPSLRMVVDLDDLDASTWNHLTGNSGHAFHENYVDQIENWKTGAHQPWYFNLPKISATTKHTLNLVPKS